MVPTESLRDRPEGGRPESFATQYAATRAFSHGTPSAIRIAPDDSCALFLRSHGSRESLQLLWSVDLDTTVETVVADPRELAYPERDIAPEEQARRERARESGDGIVGFSTSRDFSVICFQLGGRLFVSDKLSAPARDIGVDGVVVDPRYFAFGRQDLVRSKRRTLGDRSAREGDQNCVRRF